MAYGKPMKKNFYTSGSSGIEMPPLGEMPPILADSPELFGSNDSGSNEIPEQETHDQESDVIENAIEQEDQEEQEEAVVSQPKFKTKKAEENFRNLRESRERAEWERDTIKAQMLEMQRAMQGKSSAQVPEQEPDIDDFNFDMDDDALIDGKDAKRLAQELKKVKKQLKNFGAQSNEAAIEAKIRSAYPDFNDVVSVANVTKLNQEYPEIAQSLRDTPDLFNKAAAAYSIMKKFGIHKDMRYEEDKMKAIKNAQKPRPVASVSPQQGDSPLTKANAFANGLSEDLKKQLLEEMKMARRNI